jgi:ADP-ribose pyrophosphatase YjhB (NUDIX family)
MEQVFSVKGIVAYRKNVLLLKHRDVPEDWILPGGKLFIGEMPRVGLVREIKEETGLDAHVDGELGTAEWAGLMDGVWRKITGIFFGCTTGSYLVTLDADHTMSKWINPREYAHEGLVNNSWEMMERYLQRYG